MPTRPSLGVCALPNTPDNAPRPVRHAAYIHEVLGHFGVGYRRVEPENLADTLAELTVLVTVGEGALPDALADWVASGGAWLSVGGICQRPELLGVAYQPSTFSLWGGALRLLGDHYANDATLPIPLHGFGGIAATAAGATVCAHVLDRHQCPTEQVALARHSFGDGHTALIATDLIGTIVRIQQGIAVTQDGLACPDGTGPVSDGVLKSDDGQVLDWDFDRQYLPGVPALRAFLEPMADHWKALLLTEILALCEKTRTPLPMLWLWPRALPAVGHLSHDTDGNDPAHAELLLAALDRADAKGTWCVILPGYDDVLLRRIESAGHELATHYDAMSAGTTFCEAEFDAQWQELCAKFSESPVTNKNHYLRWEGDDELWRWCVARRLKLDQSKGASKTGEAGFNFGTCHLYRPVDRKGAVLPVLEMATTTQDLLVFAPKELAAPLLDAAVRFHGIAHFLFHPAHFSKPGVADAMVETVAAGRALGMEWWTGRQFVAWTTARQQATWRDNTLHAGDDLEDATVVVCAPGARSVTIGGIPATPATRFGKPCFLRTATLAAGQSVSFEVHP